MSKIARFEKTKIKNANTKSIKNAKPTKPKPIVIDHPLVVLSLRDIEFVLSVKIPLNVKGFGKLHGAWLPTLQSSILEPIQYSLSNYYYLQKKLGASIVSTLLYLGNPGYGNSSSKLPGGLYLQTR